MNISLILAHPSPGSFNHAIIFNTANTPDQREREVFGDPPEMLWKNCVFDLCGVKNVQRRTFTVVVASTPQQRAAWPAEVRETVERFFPGCQGPARQGERK